MEANEVIGQRNVMVERMPHNGALILSALVRGYRKAKTYYGHTRREAVRLFVDEANREYVEGGR